MAIILTLIAAVLSAIFMPVGFLYSMLRLALKVDIKVWLQRVNQYFFVIAVSIDQMANVIMQELFNDIMIKKGGYQFGSEDETLSSVFGKNFKSGHLTWIGKLISLTLNLLDPGHVTKAIEEDETNKPT